MSKGVVLLFSSYQSHLINFDSRNEIETKRKILVRDLHFKITIIICDIEVKVFDKSSKRPSNHEKSHYFLLNRHKSSVLCRVQERWARRKIVRRNSTRINLGTFDRSSRRRREREKMTSFLVCSLSFFELLIIVLFPSFLFSFIDVRRVR